MNKTIKTTINRQLFHVQFVSYIYNAVGITQTQDVYAHLVQLVRVVVWVKRNNAVFSDSTYHLSTSHGQFHTKQPPKDFYSTVNFWTAPMMLLASHTHYTYISVLSHVLE